MTFRDLIPWRKTENIPIARDREFPFYPLQQRVNELFDSFFRDFAWTPSRVAAEWPGAFWPEIDVSDSGELVKVTAELPGLSEKDVEITLEKDTLILKGEKREEKEEKGKNYWHSERRFGSFRREIPLPEGGVDESKVKAEFKDGVLTITLPKTEEAKKQMKKIPIKTH
ncbi:MAG: Hsp20/alpha crystallin family protein [Syntrophaceae bacterium]|nr:Hsp20/alpha crystallin family protein [Syntrophaceae bacterium]